jgi:hypothetical protein
MIKLAIKQNLNCDGTMQRHILKDKLYITSYIKYKNRERERKKKASVLMLYRKVHLIDIFLLSSNFQNIFHYMTSYDVNQKCALGRLNYAFISTYQCIVVMAFLLHIWQLLRLEQNAILIL